MSSSVSALQTQDAIEAVLVFGIPVEIITVCIGLVSLLGLARPEITALVKYMRSRVEFHPTASVEFTFAEFGSHLVIQGTLNAIRDAHFVKSIRVSLKNTSNGEEKTMPWMIFRSPGMLIDAGTSQQKERQIWPAYPFSLQTDEDRLISVLFSDDNLNDQAGEVVKSIQSKWIEFTDSKFAADYYDLKKDSRSSDIIKLELFHIFKDKEFGTEGKPFERFSEFLLQNVFWESGKYKACIEIKTSRPKRLVNYEFEFGVTSAQAKRMNENVAILEPLICGLPVKFHIETAKITGFRQC